LPPCPLEQLPPQVKVPPHPSLIVPQLTPCAAQLVGVQEDAPFAV
jgi:hypothetical protein